MTHGVSVPRCVVPNHFGGWVLVMSGLLLGFSRVHSSMISLTLQHKIGQFHQNSLTYVVSSPTIQLAGMGLFDQGHCVENKWCFHWMEKCETIGIFNWIPLQVTPSMDNECLWCARSLHGKIFCWGTNVGAFKRNGTNYSIWSAKTNKGQT